MHSTFCSEQTCQVLSVDIDTSSGSASHVCDRWHDIQLVLLDGSTGIYPFLWSEDRGVTGIKAMEASPRKCTSSRTSVGGGPLLAGRLLNAPKKPGCRKEDAGKVSSRGNSRCSDVCDGLWLAECCTLLLLTDFTPAAPGAASTTQGRGLLHKQQRQLALRAGSGTQESLHSGCRSAARQCCSCR